MKRDTTFESKAIKALVQDYLTGFVLDLPKDTTKFTPKEWQEWKELSRVINNSKVHQHVVRKIVDYAKDTIAGKSQDDIEVSFNRGIIYAFKLYGAELSSFLAGPNK